MCKKTTSLLMVVMLFMACSPNNGYIPPSEKSGQYSSLSFDQITFEKERQSWLEQDVPDYSFYLEYIGPVGKIWKGTIAVKDGVVLGFVPDDSNNFLDVLDEKEGLKWLNTITGIYTIAFNKYKAISDDNRKENSHYTTQTEVVVEYNSEFHFPQHYYRSTTIFNSDIAGGEGLYEEFWITKFTITPAYGDAVMY